MNKLIIAASLLLALTAQSPIAVVAQTTQSERTENLLMQIRELDLLNQILPVLFTKEQLKEVLPIIERAHEAEKRVHADETTVLREFEAEVEAALEAAYKEGQVPNRQLMGRLAMAFNLLQAKRASFVEEESRKVYEKLKEVLNEGQIAAAANSLDPAFLGGGVNMDEFDQDQKLRLWAQFILLDPAGYDVLIRLYEELPE